MIYTKQSKTLGYVRTVNWF